MVVANQVWLAIDNIKTAHPSKKVDFERPGPFNIKEVVSSNAYRLALLWSMKIDPFFHVSLLELAVGERRVHYHFPGRSRYR